MDLHLVARTLFSAFLLLDFQVSRVSACQCARHTHPQQYMCEADYVIRGKVLSEDFVRIGDIGKQTKEQTTPTLPPTIPPTTKRPPFKFPQWREPQWWEPVLHPPRPQEQPHPRWQNPFLGINLPPLMLADQPQPQEEPRPERKPQLKPKSQPQSGPLVPAPPQLQRRPKPAPKPKPQSAVPVLRQLLPQPLPAEPAQDDLPITLGAPLEPIMVADRPLQYKEHESPWHYRRRYKVKVDKVYKGEERIAARTIISVYTESNEGMCGKELSLDTRYLIAGYFHDGLISIDLCDWVVEKSKLTKDQKKGLRHTYKKYCDTCRIKSGTLYWPPEAKEKDVCPYNPYLMDNTDCEGRFSSCIRYPDGTCNWMQTKGLKNCKRKSTSLFS